MKPETGDAATSFVVARAAPEGRLRRFWLAALLASGLCVGTLVLYFPVAGFELMGDDFILLQPAHRASHHAAALFANIDWFWRPTTTLILLVDLHLWGQWGGGYHLLNLGLHAVIALLLVAVARRLGLPPPLAWLVGLTWVTSPFCAELAYWVGCCTDQLLAIGWLGLVLAWPGPGAGWRPGRVLAVVGIVTWVALSKETWVVTAGLVLLLELIVHRVSLRQALPPVVLVGVATLGYSIVHFLLLPRYDSYFEHDLSPLAKLPHQLAAFLYLEPLAPVGFRLTWQGLVALAAVAALTIAVAFRAGPAALVGLGLLVLPNLPTAFVPYLPVRYTAIPYLGFLLLLGAGVAVAWRLVAAPARHWLAAGLALLWGGVLLAGVVTVRGDLRDISRVSGAHAVMLAEIRAMVPEFPVSRPVLVLRQEREYPLREVARSLEGMPKLFYPRGRDAYGLADTAAVLDWVNPREGLVFERRDDGATAFGSTPGAVVAHRVGGWVWLSRDVPRVGELAERVTNDGMPAQIVMARLLQ